MKDFAYQQDAINKIVRNTLDFLDEEESKLIVFQAPTGSGKTIMIAESINKIVKDSGGKRELAFVWISVNSLHEQSKESLEDFFGKERIIDCVSVNELTDAQISTNQMLFINWESLNRENALFIQDNENNWNLDSVIRNTKEDGRDIILIIDESHRAASTEKAKEIRGIINPDVTIEVSATPSQNPDIDIRIKVPLEDVKEAGMIKKEIQINPNLGHVETNDDIVEAAVRKRDYLRKYYEKLWKNINPLLLVQIPNRKQTDARPPEDKMIEIFAKRDISIENGKLAIWLSGDEKKINLDEIKKPDNKVEVLIFKEAIALWWDCPRATILLLQREWNVERYEFNIQTLGRIMRMPEHCHYEECQDLNIGYAYTASDNFSVVEELAKDYVSSVQMIRDNEKYQNIDLPSQFIRRKRELTRLSGDFKECLLGAAQAMKSENNFNINTGDYKSAKDIGIDGVIAKIDEKQDADFKKRKWITRDPEEINIEYNDFISDNLGGYSKARSTQIIKSSIRSLFKQFFGISNEDEIGRIVINPINSGTFVALFEIALRNYAALPTRSDEVVDIKDWQIPQSISIFGDSRELKQAKRSVLQPYFIKLDKNQKEILSGPEEKFIRWMEEKADDYLQWWNKNGERESKFFGISYQKNWDGNNWNCFYPDFILRTKKEIIVVEIKDDTDFKPENLLKINAGKAYISAYTGIEKVQFFMISPNDYASFFDALNKLSIDSFRSSYEERLAKYVGSQKIKLENKTTLSDEEKELLKMYEEENKKLFDTLKDKELENDILNQDLEKAIETIRVLELNWEGIAKAVGVKQSEDTLSANDYKIKKPFIFCVLGEVGNTEIIMTDLQKFFSKLWVSPNEWDMEIFNNTKLQRSDVLQGLRKWQSKYQLAITWQIHHHSWKWNESANILTELKKEKYIDHLVGCSPKDLLTSENIRDGILGYFKQN